MMMMMMTIKIADLFLLCWLALSLSTSSPALSWRTGGVDVFELKNRREQTAAAELS